MTLNQLNYVIVVSETGSLNKAAEQLYIAQPSLTKAVRELENELGFELFHRSGRGMTLTPEGADFVLYARDLYGKFEDLSERFGTREGVRKKFGISTQHYSFAVKAFVETAKHFDTAEYEFAVRETKTKEVIDDVANRRSEIGILYLSDFNRQAIRKLLTSSGLEFHHLINCDAYVYLWKGHPLAKKKGITFQQLLDYPCLSFEQGEQSSFYYAEEILTTNEYPRTIKANDRATMLNLMVGLNGYTLCSGIICEELNGDDFVAIPYRADKVNPNSIMELGYITIKDNRLSAIGELYITELKKYLGIRDTMEKAGRPGKRSTKTKHQTGTQTSGRKENRKS